MGKPLQRDPMRHPKYHRQHANHFQQTRKHWPIQVADSGDVLEQEHGTSKVRSKGVNVRLELVRRAHLELTKLNEANLPSIQLQVQRPKFGKPKIGISILSK